MFDVKFTMQSRKIFLFFNLLLEKMKLIKKLPLFLFGKTKFYDVILSKFFLSKKRVLNTQKLVIKERKMAYIIAEPCVGTCDTACVEVCPVDCINGPFEKEGLGEEAKADGFDPTDLQLYIDPEECIDCGACEPECPVEAIFEEDALPEEWNKFIEIYAAWYQE